MRNENNKYLLVCEQENEINAKRGELCFMDPSSDASKSPFYLSISFGNRLSEKIDPFDAHRCLLGRNPE